jgi:hypothetical protein
VDSEGAKWGGRASWRVRIRIRCTEHPGLDSLPPTDNRVQGSGLTVQDSGFWIQGSGFRVGDLRFRVRPSLHVR